MVRRWCEVKRSRGNWYFFFRYDHVRMPWRPPASAKFGNDLVMENVNGNDLAMRIYCTLGHIVKFSHVRAQNQRRMLYYTINLISCCFGDVYGKTKNNPLIKQEVKRWWS